jgi:hypothetical protein
VIDVPRPNNPPSALDPPSTSQWRFADPALRAEASFADEGTLIFAEMLRLSSGGSRSQAYKSTAS